MLTTLLKIVASSTALITNAIQLAEISDQDGAPLRGQKKKWESLSRLVAFEGRQILHHLEDFDDLKD